MMRVLFIQNIAEIENINVENIFFTVQPKTSRSHTTHIYLIYRNILYDSSSCGLERNQKLFPP